MTIEDQIAAHIREHGVTRCPTAACCVTTAVLTPEDAAALREHGLQMEKDTVHPYSRQAQLRRLEYARAAASAARRKRA